MRRTWILLLLAGCSSSSEPTAAPPAPAPAEAPKPALVRIDRANDVRESNAVALGTIGGSPRAFVADEDDGAIVEIDVAASTIVATTPVGSRVRDVLVMPDGRLAATLPDVAAVVVLARDVTGALHEEKRVRPGEEPLALALDAEGKRLFVTTGASHSLVQLDAASLEERTRWSLGREPRAALVTSDGSHVIVTHAAETFASIVDRDGIVVERDIGNRELCRGGGDCSGRRFARNAQAIARVGERGIVIPAAQMLPVPPGGFTKRSFCSANATRSRGYGLGNEEAGPPAVSDLPTFDDKDGSLFGNGVSRFDGPMCLLPRAAAGAGDDVLVACLGSARVIRYRGTPVFDFAHAKRGTPAYFNDGILVTVRTEAIPVPAGPTGIAATRDGKRAFVWSAFARTLTPIDVDSGKTSASIHVDRVFARDEAWLKGRELFFTNGDKRISHDGRACASCHVDGRDDGLAWKTPNGMRRTRLLGGQTTTAPFGWTGENATLDAHVQVTFKQLGGTGLPEDERKDLLTFVSSLPRPPSSPAFDDETQHGREVFTNAECATCHTNGTSDRVVHDVGTGGSFLTPTLSGIATRGRHRPERYCSHL